MIKPSKMLEHLEDYSDSINLDIDSKVPSGIPGFDEICFGGFEKYSSNLIVGPSGCGKTIFLYQFIYTGAVFYEEPGIIVSLDKKKENIFSKLRKFNWLFDDIEKKGLISFVNIKPHELKKFIEEGGGLIWDSAMEINAKRLIIDSLSSFDIYFDSLYDLREGLINLFELTKKLKCTSLFSYIPTRKSADLLYLADAIIKLGIHHENNVKTRTVEILKLEGSTHLLKKVPFEILPGEGMVVYPQEDIF